MCGFGVTLYFDPLFCFSAARNLAFNFVIAASLRCRSCPTLLVSFLHYDFDHELFDEG
jgi:hypothetical protein